ncbi:transmembrane protein, putative [Rhizoctonia solani AG-3 Rhs1AP]|uniref:Transmembrane protein, putative n=2 Tax=Rhizoctonia solani AG-3 TaxID=1086053 RepID=X8J6R8_9AGAM|nr:transmembrane protein, putative [Rhizoctonia solani AG-3 Rhs1AP]
MEPNNKAQRKVYWLLLHLPFLLCVVLLLQGELDNYISRLFVLNNDLLVIWSQPDIKTNGTLIKKLINYNITWSQEYDILAQRMSRGGLLQTNISTPLSNEQKEELYIWHWRLSLRALVRIHTDHNTPSDAYADLNYYQVSHTCLITKLLMFKPPCISRSLNKY